MTHDFYAGGRIIYVNCLRMVLNPIAFEYYLLFTPYQSSDSLYAVGMVCSQPAVYDFKNP